MFEALDFIGGQCSALYPEKPIYDIPAFPSILAIDLIKNLEKQIERFQPTIHLSESIVGFKKEGDIFLLGHWKNYEELEENLSMPELIQTLKSMTKTEEDKRIFLAAIQGIELGKDKEEAEGPKREAGSQQAGACSVEGAEATAGHSSTPDRSSQRPQSRLDSIFRLVVLQRSAGGAAARCARR